MFESIISIIKDNIYLLLFFASLIDAIPLGGAILPEEYIQALSGIVASEGRANIFISILVSSIGMYVPQVGVYFLSKKYGSKMLNFVHVPKSFIDKLELYLDKNILMFNFFGRLTSSLRSLTAILSGIHGVKTKDFLIIELLATVIKSSFYILVGYLIGEITNIKSTIELIGIVLLTISIITISISVYTSRKIIFHK